jgi:glyceraldehyde 3-phosphate dehydrogenase
VSLSDFTFLLRRKVTVEEINDAFKKAVKNPMWKGIVEVTEEPLVSSDFVGNSASAIVDLGLTKVVDGDFVKVIAWYDNEWGYSHRLAEMALLVAKQLRVK